MFIFNMQVFISIFMTINEKLIQFVDYLDVSQRKFTSLCGLSEGALRGSKSVGTDSVIKIKRKYSILNIDWLLFDEGEMILEKENRYNLEEDPALLSEKKESYSKEKDTILGILLPILEKLEALECDIDNIKTLIKVDEEIKKS